MIVEQGKATHIDWEKLRKAQDMYKKLLDVGLKPQGPTVVSPYSRGK